MQSRTVSLIESIVNISVGLAISMILNWTVFPIFGWQITGVQNLALALIYTVVSLVRSYLIRRFFNRFSHKEKP